MYIIHLETLLMGRFNMCINNRMHVNRLTLGACSRVGPRTSCIFPVSIPQTQFPHKAICIHASIWGLNPRFFHCFVDEDMMRWCKLVSRKSHRRTLEKSVLRRANLRLVSLAWRTKVLNKQAKQREEKTVIERDQPWTTSVVGRPCLSQTTWVNLVPRLFGIDIPFPMPTWPTSIFYEYTCWKVDRLFPQVPCVPHVRHFHALWCQRSF